MSVPRPSHRHRCTRRGRLAALLVASAFVFAACGSSDDSNASSDATTTVAAADEPTGTTVVDVDDDVAIDDEGDLVETDEIVFDEEFCESVPEDFYLETTGGTIADVGARGGAGFNDDVEWATASCVFDMDDGGTITVEMLLDPETDEPAGAQLFDDLAEVSRADTTSGLEHEDVDGIGDRAAFVADAFENKLMVVTGDMVFFVSARDADIETLERPEIEQIATVTFDGLA